MSDRKLWDQYVALEKERDELRAAVRHEADCVEAAKAEIESLRAKIAEMEKQEPVATVDANDEGYWAEILPDRSVRVGQKLYALPGAKGE